MPRLSRFGLNSGQIGAVSELVTCADLIRRGFEVFRAVSQSSTCDLMAIKAGQTYRVEVKTAVRLASGTIVYPMMADHRNRFDILALVVDGTPIYEPALDEVTEKAA